MGVLDDAIREHIELKRKHGATEQELELEAQEALGPARRAAPPAVEEDPAAEIFAEQPTQIVSQAAPDEGVRQAPVDTSGTHPAPEVPEAEDVPAEGLSAGDTPARGFVPVDDEPFAVEPAPTGASEEEEEDAEDVLEETPDFLQETPEHDRLWFEQKPPRGFDFDE